MGLTSGTIPWISMNVMGKRTRLFTHYVDDTLGITHTHMVAGFVGGFMVGIFATAEGTAAFGSAPTGGAIAGNGKQVWLQIVSAKRNPVSWNEIILIVILGWRALHYRLESRLDIAHYVVHQICAANPASHDRGRAVDRRRCYSRRRCVLFLRPHGWPGSNKERRGTSDGKNGEYPS